MSNLVPMVIQRTPEGERAMDIYSCLLKERIIDLSSDFNNVNCSTIRASLLYLDNESHDDIWIYVDSPGGSVFSGMAVLDTIATIQSKVNVVVTGMAASMGSVLLVGATGKRYMLPHAQVMTHQVLSGAQGQSVDITRSANHTHNTQETLLLFFMRCTGRSREELQKVMNRDTWFTAQEAIDFGLADEILERKHQYRFDVPQSAMRLKDANEDWS